MGFKPVFDMRATTLKKAFFLNAIVLATIAATSIELRIYLDIRKETKDWSELKKMFFVLVATFIIDYIIYIIARILFGFGESLLTSPPFATHII